MEFEFEPVDDSMLYEATVEEIALEGLDGITLQALVERLTNRENNPIAKEEAKQVFESLWQSIKRDVRLRFYLLPQRRQILQIWDRNQHHDPKGNVEEPHNAPDEIYTYKCIEKRDIDVGEARHRQKLELKVSRNTFLNQDEIGRISIGGVERGEVILEGIRFADSSFPATPAGKSKDVRKKIKCNRAKGSCGLSTIAIRGSCPQFENRKDITDKLRSTPISYMKALDMLGNRLVVVASQFLRESLLLQSSNQIDINALQYCMVERVGRARYYGEQARGKISLTVISVDPKNLFYMRKVLLSDGIISKQPLVMRFGDSKTATLISVFHLPHFFHRQEHPEAMKIRKIFAYVCNAPNNYVDYFKLQGIFGKYLMRTLIHEYTDFVKVEDVPFAVLYAADLESESKPARREALAKRKIRVITLRQQGLSLRELIQKQLRNHESMDEEDPEGSGEQHGGDDGEDPTFDWTYCYAPERGLAHESELSQLVRFLIGRGPLGIKQQELSQEMCMTSLDARSVLRYLVRWKIANSHMEDTGKTKANCLTYFKCGIIKKEQIKVDVEVPMNESVADSSILQDEENDSILPDSEPSRLVAGTSSKKRPFVWKSRKMLPLPKPTPNSANQSDNNEEEPFDHRTKTPPPQDPLDTRTGISPKTMPIKNRKRTAKEDEDDLPPPLVKKRKRNKRTDIVDVQVSNERDRQRADWNSDEDRALLYVFIGSVLFIPRYNLDKVFVYNATQMRDILHRRLPETKTKTSAIIRRRVHSMLKSRTLFSKYRTMLDKALRDEELYTKLIEPHLPPPSILIFHRVRNSALEAVMDYLANKFDPNNGSETESIVPVASGETGTDLETLLDSRELRRMETIWTDIWANVFHVFYRNKKVWTPIVPMQPEEVMQLHTEGFVIEEQGPSWVLPYSLQAPPISEDSEVPCIYSDDQLEFAFDVATTLVSTADKVITEEPPSSSSEDEGDNNSSVTSHVKKSGIITERMKGQSGYIPDFCTGERNAASSIEVFAWTYRSLFMSVLLGGGGNPETLRSFMSPIPDTALSRLANSLRSRGVFTMVKTSRKLILTNAMKRKLTNYLHPNAFRTTTDLLTSLEQNSRASFSLMSVQNIGAAYLLSEIGPMVCINYSMPSSIITVREEWRQEYESILASQQVTDTEVASEEIALRLLRFRLNADTSKSRFVEKDFFDINLPQIEITPKEQITVSVNALIFGERGFPTEKFILERELLQTVSFNLKDGSVGIKHPVLGKYEGLYNLIDITGDVGISIFFLLKHFKRYELKQGLEYLMENCYVYMVGIRNRKFVTSQYMEKWTVLITADIDATPNRVVVRPWIDAFGEINWKVVDRVMVGLLGQLHRHSHVFIQKLTHSLSPLFSPVEVFICICALKELQIVDLFKLRDVKPGHQFNFYSKWSEMEDEGDERDDLEAPMKDYSLDLMFDLENAWVELMPFDVSKYAKIQSIILPNTVSDEVDEEEEYNRFDPEDVEIMIGQQEDEDEDEELHS